MRRGRLLIPNIAAEEGNRWRTLLGEPAVATLANLWRLIFAPDAHFPEWASLPAPWPDGGADCAWPEELGPRSDAAVFDWLEDSAGATAWLNTQEAADFATEQGAALSGPGAAAVSAVHDKAFAQLAAREERLLPPSLRGLIEVLDPEQLRAPDAAIAHIDERVAGWPDWTHQRFTLKPRFGSSGRGRGGGEGIAPGDAAVRGGLARLAARGGAVLEPWLERSSDLSAQLHVGPEGSVTLLGTLELCVAASGLYTGHRGFVDARGRVHAGTGHDEELREPAALVARAAAEAGFSGPCGVDAFAFRGEDGAPELRPVVEFNARFTAGIVVIGLLRRALQTLKAGIGIAAEQRRAFLFLLDSPASGWPPPDTGESLQLVPLWCEGSPTRPALLIARERASLDRFTPGF